MIAKRFGYAATASCAVALVSPAQVGGTMIARAIPVASMAASACSAVKPSGSCGWLRHGCGQGRSGRSTSQTWIWESVISIRVRALVGGREDLGLQKLHDRAVVAQVAHTGLDHQQLDLAIGRLVALAERDQGLGAAGSVRATGRRLVLEIQRHLAVAECAGAALCDNDFGARRSHVSLSYASSHSSPRRKGVSKSDFI